MASVEQELASYSRERLLEIAALLNPDGLPDELATVRWKRRAEEPPRAPHSPLPIRAEPELAHLSRGSAQSDLAGARDRYQRVGDNKATTVLGLLRIDQREPGRAGTRDWWEQAAAAGDTDAMVNLGLLLANRWDPPDLPAARDWLEKAAAAGHTDAMFNLGFLLANRWDPPDLPAARDWYEKAAAAGHTDAMVNLGFLLANRWDPPDLPAARDWYEKAAAAGHTDAMLNLGVLLAIRWDPPDLPAARDWWQKAAIAGSPDAMNHWEEALKVLTPREKEVMTLIAQGLSTAAIAERLVIGEVAVRHYTHRMTQKLGLQSRTQVVAVAYMSGLLQPDERIPVHPD